jgi:hypothetical protein
MMSTEYEELISQALQLSPVERLAMLEELAISLKQELSPTANLPEANEGFSAEEIAELTRIDPAFPSEIAAQGLLGTWADLGISSGENWVNEAKQKRKERRQWSLP